MDLYRKCTAKPYYSLITDATLASDSASCFTKNLLQRILKLIMTIGDKIKDEKSQYDISREATKISVLSPGKTDQCEYLTGERILSSNQRQLTEQANFTYFSLGKALGKQTKTLKSKKKTNRCYYQSKQKTRSFNQLRYF